MVEHMHGTFEAILRKCVERKQDWVVQIPYVLFVLRQMPHADSGFSPFELVYGFRVRTPLDALYYGLVECEHGKLNVCDWVANMADRLEFVRDAAALNLSKAREKRLIQVNKDAKQRKLTVDSRVLYRLPGMTCKLGESWEGPYTVVERLGTVNYTISKDGTKRHSKVIHVNCLKEYVECGSVCRLDVVVEEECEERNKLEGVCEGFSRSELDGVVLEEFVDVFSDRPGNTRKVLMTIDTGNH